MSNFSDIIEALYDAVEAITPGVNPNVPFLRWRGEGILGATNNKPPPASRYFQWVLGPALIPRTMSGASDASTWNRSELQLVVAYQPNQGRRDVFDSQDHGHILEVEDDRRKLWGALVIANPISAAQYHAKRIIPLNPWESSSRPQYRTFRFDCEYASS